MWNGSAWVNALSGSGGAPTTSTYLLQTASGSLPNAQAMGALGTGLVKNTTTTGVQTIGVDGTDYYGPNTFNTYHSISNGNFFLGIPTIPIGNSTLTGISNFGIGYGMSLLTTGDSNFAFGNNVLRFLTTGNDNIAISGNATLFNIVSGSRNIGIGSESFRFQVLNDSIAIGYRAGFLQTNYDKCTF